MLPASRKRTTPSQSDATQSLESDCEQMEVQMEIPESIDSEYFDLREREELPRSCGVYDTRLYLVKLKKDWNLIESVNANVTNTFRKGQSVVLKIFHGGPEEEKKVEAQKRCSNEYKKLYDLNEASKLSNMNWFVIALGMGQDSVSLSGGPFVVLEQGECSLGHLLHHRKGDCPSHVVEGDSATISCGEPISQDALYTPDHCFTYILQIHGALNFLHQRSLIHRDLKSYNVLLFNDKTLCKLCDFEDCRDVNFAMTAKMGTTWWRAPELFQIDPEGLAKYGPSSDRFSFGLLMCEALFREEPFICYYTGKMKDKALDPSRVYDGEFLSALPGHTEVDHCAMYIERSTDPTKPRVVLSVDRCVFKGFSTETKLWELIDDLLRWNPADRISGEELARRIEADIRPLCTRSPKPIILPSTTDNRTDTGANASEHITSFKPAESREKVYFNTIPVVTDEEARKTIRKRLDEHREFMKTLIEEKAIGENLEYNLGVLVNSKGEFVLQISGGKSSVRMVKDFCSTRQEFVKHWSDLFEHHPDTVIRGLKFQVVAQVESKRLKMTD